MEKKYLREIISFINEIKIIFTIFEMISIEQKSKGNESSLNMVECIKCIELKKGRTMGLHVPPCDSLCPSQLETPT